MDFNDFFLPSLLPYGHYDTKKVHSMRTRVWANYLCAFIEFFCALKMIVIILWPWQKLEITLYLVELYIVNNSLQKFFYVCVVGLHLHCEYDEHKELINNENSSVGLIQSLQSLVSKLRNFLKIP